MNCGMLSNLQTLVVNLCVIGLLFVSISLLTLCKFVLAQLIVPVILVWMVYVSGLTGSMCMHYISEVAHCLLCSVFVFLLLLIVLVSVYLTCYVLQQCRLGTCFR